MAALDFPSSPTIGQTYTAPLGQVYKWDGTVWTLTAILTAGPAGGDLSGTYPNPTILSPGPLSLTTYAKISRSTGQSIPNLTGTNITFDTVVTNQGGLWNAGSPDRLTISRAGWYLIGAGLSWTNATGGTRRSTSILINGGVLCSDERLNGAGAFPSGSPAAAVLCAVNDYCQLATYQDSGGALNTTAPTFLWACRVM